MFIQEYQFAKYEQTLNENHLVDLKFTAVGNNITSCDIISTFFFRGTIRLPNEDRR